MVVPDVFGVLIEAIFLIYPIASDRCCEDGWGKSLADFLEGNSPYGKAGTACFACDNFSEGLDLLKPTKKHWLYSCDQYWKKLQPISDWFYFLERIGKQRKSYSNLGLAVADYGF